MPLFEFECKSCNHSTEVFLHSAFYNASKDRGFEDLFCDFCGRCNTLSRKISTGVADMTPRGTWGKYADPNLAGKEYSGDDERKRQAKTAGVDLDNDSDVGRQPAKPKPARGDLARLESLLTERGPMTFTDWRDALDLSQGKALAISASGLRKQTIAKTGEGLWEFVSACVGQPADPHSIAS